MLFKHNLEKVEAENQKKKEILEKEVIKELEYNQKINLLMEEKKSLNKYIVMKNSEKAEISLQLEKVKAEREESQKTLDDLNIKMSLIPQKFIKERTDLEDQALKTKSSLEAKISKSKVELEKYKKESEKLNTQKEAYLNKINKLNSEFTEYKNQSEEELKELKQQIEKARIEKKELEPKSFESETNLIKKRTELSKS